MHFTDSNWICTTENTAAGGSGSRLKLHKTKLHCHWMKAPPLWTLFFFTNLTLTTFNMSDECFVDLFSLWQFFVVAHFRPAVLPFLFSLFLFYSFEKWKGRMESKLQRFEKWQHVFRKKQCQKKPPRFRRDKHYLKYCSSEVKLLLCLKM